MTSLDGFHPNGPGPLGTTDDFCIPEECCPKQIKTPLYPSPNSCLPEEELAELEEKIEEANRLLLDLGLSDRGNGFDENEEETLSEEARMRAFDGLLGQKVKVKVDCAGEAAEPQAGTKTRAFSKKRKARLLKTNGKRNRKTKVNTKQNKRGPAKKKLEGIVHLVGRNFVVLRNEGKSIVIPFSNICSMKPSGRFSPPENQPDLECIDPCFRRALTFNFGETVAANPELIQLFYRLTFPIYLLVLQGEKVKVRLPEKTIYGILSKADRESVTICLKNDKERDISLEQICFIILH